MPEFLSDLPVTDLVPDGRHGRNDGAPGVVAQVVDRLAVATLAARKGAVGRVTDTARDLFGISLLDAPQVSVGPNLVLIGTAPGRWLAAAHETPHMLVARLREAFGNNTAVTDQSDANLVLDVYGSSVRDALAKLVPVDLHPSAFGPANAAATSVALIPLVFWQLNDSPAYRFAVPRSFGPAFLRALTAASAEFGIEVLGTGRG